MGNPCGLSPSNFLLSTKAVTISVGLQDDIFPTPGPRNRIRWHIRPLRSQHKGLEFPNRNHRAQQASNASHLSAMPKVFLITGTSTGSGKDYVQECLTRETSLSPPPASRSSWSSRTRPRRTSWAFVSMSQTRTPLPMLSTRPSRSSVAWMS
jgi:hypothetical protein